MRKVKGVLTALMLAAACIITSACEEDCRTAKETLSNAEHAAANPYIIEAAGLTQADADARVEQAKEDVAKQCGTAEAK